MSNPKGTPDDVKQLASEQAVENAVMSVCDVMRRSNCTGAMQYVPEFTWLLFLRILDEREQQEAAEMDALGLSFTPSLEYPYRWRDWAAPGGEKREALDEAGAGKFMDFVNNDLIPHLKALEEKPDATPRQKIISEVMSGIRATRIDTETNLKDVLDRVHKISERGIDTQHVFPLSKVYEVLLQRLGEKSGSGGEFFTPREVIRAMVQALDLEIGDTVYDPCCGTGGFLAQAYEHLYDQWKEEGGDATQLDTLKHDTFYGREKDNTIYPVALANLVLHGIDEPNIWHGNTLTGDVTYAGLLEDAPDQYDVILTNPPFGGKEGKHAQNQFAYKTSATQVLFLQHIIDRLNDGGRCAMVIDEGVLFRTNENAFVQTKRKLLNECTLHCIVSLPAGTFASVGASVKTDLLFFTKGESTKEIWYYDLSHHNITKTNPLTLEHFEDFFERMPERSDGPHSWTVNLKAERKAAKKKAKPLREKATRLDAEASRVAERIESMKQAAKKNGEDLNGSIEKMEAKRDELRQKVRDLTRRADGLEDSVYDLKAVNPNAETDVDDRTPEELMQIIEQKGQEVQDALAALRALSSVDVGA
jgi:type I restriction enzyme M protein